MSASFLEGRRRSGKSKFAVGKIQEYLNEGRRVATNLDLFLENLCPDNTKAYYTRIPDFPRSQDLFSLGNAYPELNEDEPDTYDENKNGVVVLDELLTSFNSRSWNDKDRLKVINWIVLSGKKGWDLYFIGQSFDAVDAQIRDTVVDRIISCRSNENLYPGQVWNLLIKPLYMKMYGKGHFAFFYDGKSKSKEYFSYRLKFQRNDLHNCYKTGQVFKKDVRFSEGQKGKMIEIDDRSMFSSIGKHYFNKPKTGMVLVKEPKPKVRFNFKLDYKLIAATSCALFFAVMYFIKPTVINEKTVIKPTIERTIPKIKKEIKSFVEVKTDLKDSDIGIIYINCFSYVTNGDFTYCFTNDSGEIVNPKRIGYKVVYVNDCHAKLARSTLIYDVYCNPFNKAPDPIESEPQMVASY